MIAKGSSKEALALFVGRFESLQHGCSGITGGVEEEGHLHHAQHANHAIANVVGDHAIDVILT